MFSVERVVHWEGSVWNSEIVVMRRAFVVEPCLGA